MGSIREIYQLGNPVLRKKAKSVTSIHDPMVKMILDDMKATLNHNGGLGLAAPQIGESLQIVLVCLLDEDEEGRTVQRPPMCVINPNITHVSKKTERDWEGCLSIPGIRGLVRRPVAIQLTFMNENGQFMKIEAEGYNARIFLHEMDHLDGKVFLDHISSSHDIVTDKEYLRLMDEEDQEPQDVE